MIPDVRRVKTAWGWEWQCQPGQVYLPIGCERHPDHFFCPTCEGFYGVPHTGMHDGIGQHPRGGSSDWMCACRPCKKATGRE
jgi:hypothetical protein